MHSISCNCILRLQHAADEIHNIKRSVIIKRSNNNEKNKNSTSMLGDSKVNPETLMLEFPFFPPEIPT